MLAGLLSAGSELADALAGPPGRFVVHLLGGGHRRLAQHFAGELPAPPELLASRHSEHGPVLEAVADRMFCSVVSARPFGWSVLVEAEVGRTEVGQAGRGLAWYHGEFHSI
jgi:flavin reductase (DIM6/NTAB) family NADH-FMN oxidoreductase RutF